VTWKTSRKNEKWCSDAVENFNEKNKTSLNAVFPLFTLLIQEMSL
jgi:hypothetical protein